MLYRSAFARVVLFALVSFVGVLAPFQAHEAHAGGAVLAPVGRPLPVPGVSVRMAMAIGPTATTRWSEVTFPSGPAVGWLVPIRPNASIEWAPTEWLASLDSASAPRVLVPPIAAPCDLHQSFETPPVWVKPAIATLPPNPLTLPASAAEAQTWAEARGLFVSAAETQRLGELYASGWRVAAIELAASDSPRTSPTLRVTDDGGAILPLSIGNSELDTAITLFVIGVGHAKTPATRDMSDNTLFWGAHGSSYANLREQLIGGDGWLRETSSHEALFDSVEVVSGVKIAPVVATYFDVPSCASDVQDLGASKEVQSATKLTCGTRADLAFALAGIAPAEAELTRLAGILPASRAPGSPAIAFDFGPARSAVRMATDYDRPCGVDVNPGSNGGDETSPSSPSSSTSGFPRYPGSPGSSTTTETSGGSGTTVVYVPSDGCGGGGTYVEEDSTDDTSSTTSSSSDSCSSDSSSSSSDGWDSSDSNDSCSSDSSSSDSSSDGCSSTSSSSDGWDKSDSNCSLTRKKRRGPSPLSRVILIAVACLIPLRRLTRKRAKGNA